MIPVGRMGQGVGGVGSIYLDAKQQEKHKPPDIDISNRQAGKTGTRGKMIS